MTPDPDTRSPRADPAIPEPSERPDAFAPHMPEQEVRPSSLTGCAGATVSGDPRWLVREAAAATALPGVSRRLRSEYALARTREFRSKKRPLSKQRSVTSRDGFWARISRLSWWTGRSGHGDQTTRHGPCRIVGPNLDPVLLTNIVAQVNTRADRDTSHELTYVSPEVHACMHTRTCSGLRPRVPCDHRRWPRPGHPVPYRTGGNRKGMLDASPP
jgi:hypothetical protein